MGSKGKKQTVGYKYSLGLAYALCTKWDVFCSFRMNAKVTSEPYLTSNGSFLAKTGEDNPLGSDPNSHISTIFAYDGKDNPLNPYLAKQTGENITYKGVGYFVFKGFVGDSTTTTPAYSAVVKRTKLFNWSYEEIEGDANPAVIIYYILTEMIKYDKNMVNKISFKNAAYTLYNEGLGMSFTMSVANEADEWIKEILRTIDGVLRFKDGKLEIKLLRKDYNLESLKIFDSSNSAKTTLNKKSWDEIFTKITIKFTDRQTFKEASISAINSAAKIALGYERAYSVEYMGISSSINANKIMQRLFKKLSYPLSELRVEVSSLDFDLNIGDCFIYNSNELGIKGMIFRIVGLGNFKEEEQKIEIEAVQDAFSLDSGTLIQEQPLLSKDINLDIGDIKYFEARDASPEQSISKAVIPIIARPYGFVQSLKVKDGLNGDETNATPCLLATVYSTYYPTNEIDDEGFLIKAISKDIKAFKSSDGRYQRLKYTAYVDDEQIAYGEIQKTQIEDVFKIKRIIRGLNYTDIKTHYIGSLVYLALDDGNAVGILQVNSITPTLYATASNYTKTSPTKSIKYDYKFSVEKPYPPSNIKINKKGEIVELSWIACVRLAGANYRSCDNIIAGEDEGKSEGEFNITFDGNSLQTKENFISIKTTSKVFYLKTILNGFCSKEIKVALN